MKTNSLRLGNYILGCKVTEICPDGVFAEMFHVFNMPRLVFIKEEDIEPIELTREILLKIGFEEKNNCYIYFNENVYFIYYQDTFKQELIAIVKRKQKCYSYKNELKNYDVKYLHQLQNIYYMLTNEDWNIKL